jgi:hypothetical protein
MKPILSEYQDIASLQAVGRASVQIVHDLKNQLNGLKLYATFLRKRMEKSERPADELETVNKLLGGLDRTAADLSILVQYAQPLELKRQPGVDLKKIMRGVAESLNEGRQANEGSVVIESEAPPLIGEFDSAVLSDALKSISLGALKVLSGRNRENPLHIALKAEAVETKRNGVIEWRVMDALDHDPFSSFVGSVELRMSLAAKVVEAHGGSAERQNGTLRVRLPLAP